MQEVTSIIERPYDTNMHVSGDWLSFELQSVIMSKGKLLEILKPNVT